MQQTSISLCMIVKDEQEHLSGCLNSVASVVDEIIVVDTGSTDNTVSIAQEFGARIIHSPWKEDFAYARNAGLEQAAGKWILFLDADEQLDAMDKEKLRACARQQQFEGFFLQIHNYSGDGQQGITINPVLRMFRNRPEYRFEGRIHEQIAGSICANRPNPAFHLTDIKIHHYGYQTNVVVKKNKINRNLNLIQRELEEQPDNPFQLYNIGVEYLRVGKVEEALESFRKARSLVDPVNLNYAHLLYKYEIRCLHTLGRIEDAIRLCREGIELYPDYTDLYHLKGTCHIALGQLNEAKDSLRRAIELGPAPSDFHTEEGIGTYQTCYSLGLLYEAEGNYEAAIDSYVEAVRFKTSLNPPLYRLLRLMQCMDEQDDMISLLHKRFSMTSPEAVRKVIGILLETGCCASASILLEELEGTTAEDYRLIGRTQCQLLTGNIREARLSLSRALSKGSKEDRRRLRNWRIFLDWLQASDEPDTNTIPILYNRNVKRTPELDTSLLEELEFVVRAAFVNGYIEKTNIMTDAWKNAISAQNDTFLPVAAQSLARTLVMLADYHLEKGYSTSDRKKLLQKARLTIPCKDGF